MVGRDLSITFSVNVVGEVVGAALASTAVGRETLRISLP